MSGRWRALTGSPGREAVAAGLLALALLASFTGSIPLVGRDEPRFAEAAREMLARGDFVVPTFGGVNRYDKPILVYWLTMASYALLGVNERAARLPSNLAGAALVAVLAWWARRRWGEGAGLAAGLLLSVTLTFHLEARACTADLVTVLPTTVAMLAWLAVLEGSTSRWLPAAFWGGMGLAVLGKGPVGPVTALGAAGGAWALGRRWRRWEVVAAVGLVLLGWWRLGPASLAPLAVWAGWEGVRSAPVRAAWRRLRPLPGIALLLAVVLPWAVAAWRATGGEFFAVAVGRHVVARSLEPLESHGGFPGFYLATGLVAAFPWFAFAWGPARDAWRRRGERLERFLLGWALGLLVVLELVETKLVHYWMPAYPAAVLLVVGWLWEGGGRSRTPRWAFPLGAALVAAVPVAVAVHFGLEALLPWGVAVGAPLIAGGVVVPALWGRFPRRALAVAVVASALYELVLFGGVMPRLGRELVGPRAARRALEVRRPGERLVVYKARDDELFFYLPLETRNVRPRAEMAELLRSGEPLLGLARATDLERLLRWREGLAVAEVERVRGVDLGHGRWTEIVLFRPASRPEPSPAAAPAPIRDSRSRPRAGLPARDTRAPTPPTQAPVASGSSG